MESDKIFIQWSFKLYHGPFILFVIILIYVFVFMYTYLWWDTRAILKLFSIGGKSDESENYYKILTAAI